MNINDPIGFVNELIEQHRVEIGDRPKTTPVTWKGIRMTDDEAYLVIQKMETEKLQHQKYMNSTQTAAEVTKLATGGGGIAAMVTGVALLCFPPTAIAGAVVLASGVGASGIGAMVGDGVGKIGKNSNEQIIQQLDTYIDSIKESIDSQQR
jgi:hypothetical protein